MTTTLERTVRGAIGGFLATAPMTAAMHTMHRFLPESERYPLPPRLITESIARKTGVDRPVAEEPRARAVTLSNHFLYGALAGAVYGATLENSEKDSIAQSVAKGTVFGLMLWGGSYLGWLPATGTFQATRTEPSSRNLLMIAAHAVWGAALGAAADTLEEDSNVFERRAASRESAQS